MAFHCSGGLGLGLAGTGGAPPSAFDEHYRAYSMAMLQKGGKRDHLDHGGKSKHLLLTKDACFANLLLVLMPPSALARLSKDHCVAQIPMYSINDLFR